MFVVMIVFLILIFIVCQIGICGEEIQRSDMKMRRLYGTVHLRHDPHDRG